MKKIFFLVLLFVMAFANCTNEELQPNPTDESSLHTIKMVLNIAKPQFESPSTRSATSWEEGDSILLLFDRSGEPCSGFAIYNASEQNWQVNYHGSLIKNQETRVKVFYFDDYAKISTSEVAISASTGVYADTSATYFYTGSSVTVVGQLKPLNNRLRFKGKEGTSVKVAGLITFSRYTISSAALETTDDDRSLTVQPDGYTPYIYGCFPDTLRMLQVINGDDTFSLNCAPQVLPDNQVGQSGWMDLPTRTAYNGWRIAVTSFKLNTNSVMLDAQQTYQLKATITPANATNPDIEWTSSDDKRVRVSKNGLITILSLSSEKVTITATPKDNPNLKATCEVMMGRIITANGITFKMIYVSPGTFERKNSDYSSYTHQVTLTKGYYIGQTEVTQALWKAVYTSMNNWTSSDGLGDNYPAYCISWDQCIYFVQYLNRLNLTNLTFRMPTEAEWEFAARGGILSNQTTYSGSNSPGEVAWYTSNSGSKTHPVATKAPNELCLYDMSGNVWEWCKDWSASYSTDAQTDPTGPSSGSYRVIRGGSWTNIYDNITVFHRDCASPTSSSATLGLRIVLSE